jgi:hypothetical protein
MSIVIPDEILLSARKVAARTGLRQSSVLRAFMVNGRDEVVKLSRRPEDKELENDRNNA